MDLGMSGSIMKPIISVIVPVYKTEDTLDECVASLLNQTIQEIEIILVDDGSPDKCPQKCDNLALQSKKIKVIHKENGGLSSARNAGIRAACGDYIGFVDSDDYVSPEMFQKLYSRIKKDDSDICICSHYTVSANGDVAEHYFENMPEKLEKREIVSYLILPLIGRLPNKREELIEGFVCRNLYKREILHGYEFQSERVYFAEDVVSDLTLYSKCSSISVLNECLYYYRYNGESLSNRYRPQVYILLNNLLVWEKEFLKSEGLFEDENRRLYAAGINFLIFSIQNIKKGNLGRKESNEEVDNVFQQSILSESINKVKLSNYNNKMKAFIMLCRLGWNRILLYVL